MKTHTKKQSEKKNIHREINKSQIQKKTQNTETLNCENVKKKEEITR